MKKFLKGKTLYVITFLFILFVIIGIFYLYLSDKREGSQTSMSQKTESLVFEGVPSNYSECTRTLAKYNFQQRNRSQLRCEYLVSGGVTGNEFAEGDKIKFDECQRRGGVNLTYEVACGLVFYNPSYTFPKSFNECVDEKKGEFTTAVEPRCIIEIDSSFAYNKDVATKLIKKCIEKGGSYSEEFGQRCYFEFKESTQ